MGNVAYKVFIDWDNDSVYTEETSYLVRAAGAMNLGPPEEVEGSSGMVPYCTVVLSNKTNRFSPLNTGGPIYSSLSGGEMYLKPMYIEVSVDGGAYTRIFAGVLKLPQWQTASTTQFPVASFDCRGFEEKYLNVRVSTTQSDFVSWFDTGKTEGELIESWLTDLGLTLSDWDLDDGLFVIPYSRLKDSSIIEACWKLAAACGGRFYTTADGKFRYENMQHWLKAPHTTSQETLTASDWSEIDSRLDDKDLYNRIIVKPSRGTLQEEGEIYKQDGAFVIGPGESRTFKANITGSLYRVKSITYSLTTAGGHDMSGDVVVTTTYNVESIEFDLVNGHTSKSAELSNLKIVGQVVSYDSDEQVEAVSTMSFWDTRPPRTRTISESEFIQTQAHAEVIAEFLRDRQQLPRYVYNVQETVGKVTRKLGDLITLTINGFASSDRTGYIIGIDWSIDHQGFTQTLTVMDSEALYPYMNTTPGYFIVDTNKYGDADPLRGRLFY